MVKPREEFLGSITELDKDSGGEVTCNAAVIKETDGLSVNSRGSAPWSAGESVIWIQNTVPTTMMFTNSNGVTVTITDDAVDSVFGRTGSVVAANGDYTSSQITNLSTLTGATLTAALNGIGSDNIANESSVLGATVTDALDTLLSMGPGPGVGTLAQVLTAGNDTGNRWIDVNDGYGLRGQSQGSAINIETTPAVINDSGTIYFYTGYAVSGNAGDIAFQCGSSGLGDGYSGRVLFNKTNGDPGFYVNYNGQITAMPGDTLYLRTDDNDGTAGNINITPGVGGSGGSSGSVYINGGFGNTGINSGVVTIVGGVNFGNDDAGTVNIFGGTVVGGGVSAGGNAMIAGGTSPDGYGGEARITGGYGGITGGDVVIRCGTSVQGDGYHGSILFSKPNGDVGLYINEDGQITTLPGEVLYLRTDNNDDGSTGNISITPGIASSGSSGSVSISGGFGNTGVYSGDVTIVGGVNFGNDNAGNANLYGGTVVGGGTSTGGNASVAGGTSPSGDGGEVRITGGYGGITGGDVVIRCGSGPGAGYHGNILFVRPSGNTGFYMKEDGHITTTPGINLYLESDYNVSGHCGDILIRPGIGGVGYSSGTVYIEGGVGNTGISSGIVYITGGSNTGDDNAESVTISGGVALGANAIGGSTVITGGAAPNGFGGNIVLRPGVGDVETQDGNIIFNKTDGDPGIYIDQYGYLLSAQSVPGILGRWEWTRELVGLTTNAAYVSPDLRTWTTAQSSVGAPVDNIFPLSGNGANAEHYIYDSPSNYGTTIRKLSVVASPGSQNWIVLAATGGGTVRAWFNVLSGVVGTTTGSGFIDATIESDPDGYKCSLIYEDQSTVVRIYTTTADAALSGVVSGVGAYIGYVTFSQEKVSSADNLANKYNTLLSGDGLDGYYNNAPTLWSYTSEEFDGYEGLLFRPGFAGDAVYLQPDGTIAQKCSGISPITIYLLMARHGVDSGRNVAVFLNSSDTNTRHVVSLESDGGSAEFQIVRRGAQTTDYTATVAAAPDNEFAIYAAYFDGFGLQVTAGDEVGPVTEIDLEALAFDIAQFGGNSGSYITGASSYASIMAMLVIKNPIAYGSADDTSMRNYLKSVAQKQGITLA